MQRLSKDKDLNRYLNELVAAGWTAERDGGGHTKMTSPDGKFQVRAAFTPKDKNAVKVVQRLVRNRTEVWGARHHSGVIKN